MNGLILRKAADADGADIFQLQADVFGGEQRISSAMIPLPHENSPQWWCAFTGTSMVGAVAAWKEKGQVHWGRFAIKQNMEARDATVKIVCGMGGKIIGEQSYRYYNEKMWNRRYAKCVSFEDALSMFQTASSGLNSDM